MINTKDLSVGYGKKIVISGINLEVKKGQILSLIGPNGSGKSTILKTITRQLLPMNGSICVIGKNWTELKDKELSTHISMVMTERLSPEKMTCRDIIATGRYPYTGRLGVLGEEDWKFVDEAEKLCHCQEVSDKDFNKISDGQRQRVMLARAICQNTEIIVLDEPTSFLDMYFKLDLLKIIRFLAREKQKTVIMSLHELELVKLISDRIICVNGNKVVKTGTADEIFSGNFIQKLYGIKDSEFNPLTGEIKLECWEEDKNCGNRQGNGAPTKEPTGACEDGDRKGSAELPPRSEAEGCPRKFNKTKILMVQGTMSNAGKSLIVAGLCRIFKQDGYRVAPFKSQNMALNSFITKDGLEMGRAQVMQAEAAGIEPQVCMNPILLKPVTDCGSQVIVNGKVLGNMGAREYFAWKKELVPEIVSAFEKLSEQADIIVIEGAGSPAEINLRENDIVNMGLAEILDAPVLLAGDIDRGGVFAQLLGTVQLLTEEERKRVKGLIINKFRGDKSLLDSGITAIEKLCGIPVCGVLPYVNISVDDEDSLSSRFDKKSDGIVNIGVIRLPHISNFTDFIVFEQIEGVAVHYVSKPEELKKMDMAVIPGSKNTIGDMQWLRESGMEAAVKQFAAMNKNKGNDEKPVFGICGGYQMLGKEIFDPFGVEGEKGNSIEGMGLLNCKTVLEDSKICSQSVHKNARFNDFLSTLNGKTVSGYEIHMGKTTFSEEMQEIPGGCCFNNVFGSYIHGFFDGDEIAFAVAKLLAHRKGVELKDNGNKMDFAAFKDSQYDILAAEMRKNLDMSAIYGMLKESEIGTGSRK